MYHNNANMLDEIIKKDRDKLTSYSKDDILKIVNIIKDNVRNNRFYVSNGKNRKGNEELIQEFNLTNDKIRKILLKIDVMDFCYGTHDDKDRKTILYVFAKDVNVYEATDAKITIKLYVKLRIVNNKPKYIIVISLHRLKYQIDYLFK